MDYWNNVNSLAEKVLIKIILNLFQDRKFKEAVLGFEAEAGIYPQNEAYHMTDDERQEMQRYINSSVAEIHVGFVTARYSRYERNLQQWGKLVDGHVQRMLEKIEPYFRDEAKEWIIRLVFEYLSCCRRLEVLTGLSLHFFVDFIIADDWLAEGRLDEKVLAERLIADRRLTVLQQYKIACTYCLTDHRLRLWRLMSSEERDSLNKDANPLCIWENSQSVVFWSYHMKAENHHIVNGEANRWMGAAEIAVYDGNVFALREAWNKLRSCRQEADASQIAYRCLARWRISKTRDWKRMLLEPHYYSTPLSFADLCMPIHYARMMSFLFMNMDEDELEECFQEILTGRNKWNILIYFLDWPNLNYFIPTVRFLQGFIHETDMKNTYWEILVVLASWRKTEFELIRSSDQIKIDKFCEYRRLLRTLWNETPGSYKRFMFTNMVVQDANNNTFVTSKGTILLLEILKRNPFLEEDKGLFQRILLDATIQEKKSFWVTEEYKKIFVLLVWRENWSLLNWLMKESFNEEEVSGIRRWYLLSDLGRWVCFELLLEQKEVLLNDLICWSLESADERSKFKRDLINYIPHTDKCLYFLSKGNFFEAQRLINFCLEPGEINDFKEKLANYDDVFYSLILEQQWEILDEILSWCFDSEEKIIQFKKRYFSSDGVDIHFHFVFQEYMEGIEQFYKWFDLSPEQIEKLKTDTVFCAQSIDHLVGLLYTEEPLPALLLLWSLPNEERILDLKIALENNFPDYSNETEIANARLNSLINLMLNFKTIKPGKFCIAEHAVQVLFQSLVQISDEEQQ